MAPIVEIRMPPLPDCWESCGNCADGEIVVSELMCTEGESARRDEPLLVVETDKTALEIPAPASGRVLRYCVSPGECVREGTLLALLDTDA